MRQLLPCVNSTNGQLVNKQLRKLLLSHGMNSERAGTLESAGVALIHHRYHGLHRLGQKVESSTRVSAIQRSSYHRCSPSNGHLIDMDSETPSLTLPQLYARALGSSLSSDPKVLEEATTDLDLVVRMLSQLDVFSENESIQEVGDAQLAYMAVEWVKGEVQGKVNGDGIAGRMKTLKASKVSRAVCIPSQTGLGG